MKRLTTAVATLAASAAILSACSTPSASSGGSSDKKVDLSAPKTKSGTLTVVTKFADPQYAPYFVSVAKAYEQANPKVNVDLQQVGDQPYKDKIRVLAASKQLPDVYFSWAGDFANKFVRAGLSADLSSVIGPDTTWGQTFSPAALKTFETSGKQYGVPIDLDAKFMAYNKTAFANAGISGPPADFESLVADCGKLKAAGYTPIAFGNQYGWPAIHYLTQLNAYDVSASTRDKDYNPATGAFQDAGYTKALEQFKTLVTQCTNKSANGLAHEAAQANFLSGKAAMHYLESVEFPVLTTSKGASKAIADNWSFFKLPPPKAAAGDTKALTGAPDGFMVNSGSKHAALAVDFLKFMTTQQNAQKLTKEIGWLSPVSGSATPANTFPQLQQALDQIDQVSNFAVWLDTVTNADVANAYLSGAEGIVNGAKSPQAVMDAVRKAAEKAQK